MSPPLLLYSQTPRSPPRSFFVRLQLQSIPSSNSLLLLDSVMVYKISPIYFPMPFCPRFGDSQNLREKGTPLLADKLSNVDICIIVLQLSRSSSVVLCEVMKQRCCRSLSVLLFSLCYRAKSLSHL